MSYRGRGEDFRGRGRDKDDYSDRSRGRSEYSDRGRGRGDYSDRGRGRGDYSDRGRGRGDYSERGRGRGDYSDRGRGRGDYSDRGRGRGDYSDRGRSDNAGQRQVGAINPNDYMTRIDKKVIDEMENVELENLGELYGTRGNHVDIISNYFKIDFMPKTKFSQYTVVFDPEVPSNRVRSSLLAMHNDVLGETYAFDGGIIYLPKKLSSKETVVYSPTSAEIAKMRHSEIPIVEDKNKKNDDDVKITLTFTNDVPSTSPRIIQIMNLVMRRVMTNMGYKQIKRHFYNPNMRVEMPAYNMEIWPGFETSIVPLGKQLSLCADLSFHVILKQTVHQRLTDIAKCGGDVVALSKAEFIGKVVMTHYNNSTYKIDDVDFNTSVSDTFKLKDGSEITYLDYYKNHYGLAIRDKHQPLLTSYPKKKRTPNQKGDKGLKELNDKEPDPVYLIPELCLMTGMSDELRSNFQLTREMSNVTKRNPTQRSDELVKFIKSIYNDEQSSRYISKWGLKIDDKLMCIPARSLGTETIYAGGSRTLDNFNADWTRSLKNMPLLNAQKLTNWIVVYTERDGAAVDEFLRMLISASAAMSFQIALPRRLPIRNGSANSYKTQITQSVQKNTEMVLAVLESAKKEVYDVVKRLCFSELGISSQCVLGKTLKKSGLGSIAMKIGIQMNVKLGGEAWYVNLPLKHTMVVGIDVCHDPQLRKNSYGAIVCSMNQTLTKYYSKITKNCGVMEIIDNLGSNMQAAINNYKSINGVLPQRIVIFRDGVGDGQFGAVTGHEANSLNGILERYGEKAPKLVVVVVKKRVGSRFLTPGTSSFENPPPGTIVDKFLTKTDKPNFYLISQCVNQGTVNPTQYVVLYNNSGFKTDHLQHLAYKLTHLYYNWSGTIRVPAPCQYAHKLCFLASNSIRNNLHAVLENRLYYL